MTVNQLCKNCPKRNICTALCPSAEEYINQDHISQREMPIGLPICHSDQDIFASSINFTPREWEIVTLLADGYRNKHVCKILKITRGSLRIHIHRIRAKM
jgi:DNA-binding NarL/FixJ family response regulator